MAEDRHVYGEVNSKTGMKRVFTGIRRDVTNASSRPALTELYRRAGYMIALTHAPSWDAKFGRDAGTLRQVGEDEFRKTAHRINRRARAIGTDADYDEKWGPGRRLVGNYPQAFSHVALINTAHNLTRAFGPAQHRAESVAQCEQSFEQRAGVIMPALQDVIVGEPKAAGEKCPFIAG
jgi:hypothetical protein